MIDVVGMGAGGPGTIPASGTEALATAEVIIGGRRHLKLLTAAGLGEGARCVAWPSPLRSGLEALLEAYAGQRVVAVASGDPLVAGVGSTLIDLLGPAEVRIHPAVSSVALARARLGWPAETVSVVRLGAGESVDRIRRLLGPGRRLLVLSADETSPRAVADVCADAGLANAQLTVLGDLGADTESRVELTAAGLLASAAPWPRLNIVAVQCGSARTVAGQLAPGLPEDAYDHDGQITKRHVRACALAMLQPSPGEVLWDLGAGAGSVGIEWARLHEDNRVVAVEQNADRAQRIGRNAGRLGVPGVEVRLGTIDENLDAMPDPDAVFVGGGATAAVLDRCWQRLPPGGRLVVHGVTLETETLLAARHAALGGELVQLAVATAAPLGRYRGWAPARAVVQWAIVKERS